MDKSCPNCSADLVGHSCKLRCRRCNYFESCSDLEAYPTDFEGFTPIEIARPIKTPPGKPTGD